MPEPKDQRPIIRLPIPITDTDFKLALVGPTRGHDARHVVVRTRLVQNLINDGLLYEEYARWSHVRRITKPVRRLIEALDAVAMASQLPDRGAYFKHLFAETLMDHCAEADIDPEVLRSATRTMEEAHDEFTAALLEAYERWPRFETERAVAFIRSLGLNWVWLAEVVRDGFINWMYMHLYGLDYYVAMGLEPQQIGSSPDLSIDLRPKRGESQAEFLRRLETAVRDVKSAVERSAKPRGRLPEKTAAALHRYADWFYWARVRNRSYRSVAKKVFPGENPDQRRKQVKNGVARAAELLDLGAYVFVDDVGLEVVERPMG